MPSLNRVQLIGNLGRDPEARFTTNGKKYATFTLAVNHTWKSATGEKQDRTDWFLVNAWGKAGRHLPELPQERPPRLHRWPLEDRSLGRQRRAAHPHHRGRAKRAAARSAAGRAGRSGSADRRADRVRRDRRRDQSGCITRSIFSSNSGCERRSITAPFSRSHCGEHSHTSARAGTSGVNTRPCSF